MNTATYDEVMTTEYQDLMAHTTVFIDYEDYTCKVDVQYRIDFGLPPQIDDHWQNRLKTTALKVGHKMVSEECEALSSIHNEQMEESLRETLLETVEKFLTQKVNRGKIPHPQSRRFKRKDIWALERHTFTEEEYRSGHEFSKALAQLTQEGYYRLVEEGGSSKHDIFQALEV
jgi:hypothetical protein